MAYGRCSRRLATALGLWLILCAPRVRADEVDPASLPDITDRSYAIDLYRGAVLGSGRIVGMGGAAVALAEGSAGLLENPAAPAVRPATSSDKWDWDWHADWLSPALGTDFDNNGIPTTEELTVQPFLTLGGVIRYRQWALGISSSIFQQDTGDVDPAFTVGQVSIARTFYDERLTVGLGVRIGSLEMKQGQEKLFEITGSALEVGAVWRPPWLDLRVGATTSLPASSEETPKIEGGCDPLDCAGLILPSAVTLPWRIAAGVAWRRGPTRWNRKVKGDWRDERALTVAADIVITGASGTSSGGFKSYGIEAFTLGKLQRSGATTAVSIRVGSEYEWKPGRFRIRGGSYWEPGRFRDASGATVAGRLHVTLGADLRVYSFGLWDERYRVRLSLTSDGASRYANGGLSVGFWH